MFREGLKKWFMLQMWRVQQVAQPLTLVMLAITISLQVFGLIKWREDSLLSTSWIGVPMIALFLVLVIWTVAIFWDMRLRMWREQATVLVERNPYVKEKMSSKEVAMFLMVYLPLVERLAKDDPSMKPTADALRSWVKKALVQDANTAHDLDGILKYIGADKSQVLKTDKE